METNRAYYSIGINTKCATNASNFTAKAVELEDCITNWLTDAWVDLYTVNCDLEHSEVEYEITSEADTLVAKLIFMLAPKDESMKVEVLKPKMRAAFMDASNNLFPTCSFTKKCAMA